MKKLLISFLFIFLCFNIKDHYEFKNNINSVYKVVTADHQYKASCVAINKHEVVTCAHVLTEPVVLDLLMEIENQDGEFIKVNHLHLIKIDIENDLALCESLEVIPHYISCIGDVSVSAGDDCYKIGDGFGLWPHDIRTGYVACTKAYWGKWITSIRVCPGDSGGGVFNSNNKFIGLVDAIVGTENGQPTDISAIIPITKILEFLKN